MTARLEESLDAVRSCLAEGEDWNRRFEDAWRSVSGFPAALLVSSAAAGLHLAVRVLKEERRWRDGDEVIASPLASRAAESAILCHRLHPVRADVDEYLGLDPDRVREQISDRTVAVIFSGPGGNPGRLGELSRLCLARGITLILDGTSMAGTRIDGRHVGGEAAAAVFGFDCSVNLTNDAGAMLSFWNERLQHRARACVLGEAEPGFMYAAPPLLAALKIVTLSHLDQDAEARRGVANWYDEALAGCPGIAPVPLPPGCVSSRLSYLVMAESRGDLQRFLGVRSEPSDVSSSLPRASRAARQLLSLPMHHSLTRAQVQREAGRIGRFYRGVA